MSAYTLDHVREAVGFGYYAARIANALNAGDFADAGRLLALGCDDAIEAAKDEGLLPDGWADAGDFDDELVRRTSSPLAGMTDDAFLRALGARLAIVPIKSVGGG